ncbi:hypothetical protein MMC06_004197 [Schaereria dolodes]|nr:hypothetical protein [Schaereria dolodes]
MDPLIKSRDDEIIPTYEESIEQGAFANTSSDNKSHAQQNQTSLSQQLANVRTYRINSILSAYIDPLLQSQASAGLFKTTLVLVPSNTIELQRTSWKENDANDIIEGSGDAISHSSEEAVIGFPSEDYIKLVRLHGEEYVLEFWRQSAVIVELEGALKARLQASGHKLVESSEGGAPSVAASLPMTESPKAKRGFFRRSSERKNSVPTPISPASESTWRFVKESAIDPGHVKVNVGLQDVCLRVVSEMGLYETRTGKAVVVQIEIGT